MALKGINETHSPCALYYRADACVYRSDNTNPYLKCKIDVSNIELHIYSELLHVKRIVHFQKAPKHISIQMHIGP